MSTVPLPAKPYISVTEAAELIGCTVGRVRQLLTEGVIDGMKLHERAWAVETKSAQKYAEKEFTRGRPRVSQSA